MLPNYGCRNSKWETAKAEVREILVRVACRKGIIAYSELIQQIKAVSYPPHDPRYLHLLGEISTEEESAGRGMLSAIVVDDAGHMQPGPGFLELAQGLGRDTSDLQACWIREFNKVHEYWA